MRKTIVRLLALTVCFLPWLAGLRAQPTAVCGPLTLTSLTHMCPAELEQLYRQSPPGKVVEGFARGKPIYAPDSRGAALRSKLTGAVWRGKIFCAADGTLVNQWLGYKAIVAQVYYGESWFDGCPSIIMDYSQTSQVWADVRDEIREVAPGLFLGLMYVRQPCGGPKFRMYFVLQTCPACEGGG
jgi:hypothetical protein